MKPTFALTPSYLPAGLQRKPTLLRDGKVRSATYRSIGSAADRGITVTTSPTQPPAPGDVRGTVTSTVMAQGHRARLTVSDRATSLTWPSKPGQWVTVSGSAEWAAAAVVTAVAGGLQDQEQAIPPTFAVALAPAGFAVTYLSASRVVLERPGARDGRIEVRVFPASTLLEHPVGRQVTTGSRPSWLEIGDGAFRLTSRLSKATGMQISVSAKGAWTEERLRRFATGVRYTGPDPPSPQ